MEGIFYGIVEITAQDLEEAERESQKPPGEEGVFKRLVKSASQLALNSMPRFMKKRTLNTGGGGGDKRLSVDTASLGNSAATEKKNISLIQGAKTIGGIAWHQGQIIVGGISSIYKGDGRSSWDVISHFAFHWIRNTIKYSGHNIEAIRKGEAIGNNLITHVPNGVSISEVDFTTNQSQLLWYEKSGMLYQQKTETWRYPIPEEYPPLDVDDLTICGEWIVPEARAHYDPTTGTRTFSSNDSPKTKTLSPRKVILYLHGGAYILGSAKMYRTLTSLLAKESGHPVLAIDYRRAPEFPFPAGLHDAFASYLWLLKPRHPMFASGSRATHEPYRAEDIIISGDSAGGGLTMALLNYLNMYLRNEDGSLLVPLPKAAVLFSPWVDLSCSSKSWQENNGLDFLPGDASNLHVPLLPNLQHPVYSYCFGERGGRYIDLLSPRSSQPLSMAGRIPSIGANLSALADLALPQPLIDLPDQRIQEKDREWVQTSLRAEERDALERFIRHPLVSPIFGDFTGLPPLLVQVGECELLRDENLALAYRYEACNKTSETSWIQSELYKDMPHNFQLGSIWIPQAKLAIRSFSSFLAEVFGGRRVVLTLNYEEQKMITVRNSRGSPIKA